VRSLTSLIAILLLVTAAPVMVCMSDQAMSHTKSACCRIMLGKCGDMVKQGCCRTEVRTQDPLIVAHSPDLSIHWVTVAATLVPLRFSPLEFPVRWLSPDAHAPPEPRSSKPIVLRI